eukprot:COSAG02_NODE_26067_length_642_cov_0.570902_1_plen_59_part_10
MEGIGDFATMVFYNMLINTLPADQRPLADDFGPSLPASSPLGDKGTLNNWRHHHHHHAH